MQSVGLNYSYRMSGTAEPALWALDEHRVFDAGERTSLVRMQGTGASALVARPMAAGLGVCRRFATLEEHAARLAQAIGAPERGAVLQALTALRDRGLFVAEVTYFDRLNREGPDVRGSVDGDTRPEVFVRTCDRPEELARVLKQLEAHADSARSLTVVDDSAQAEVAQANRQACSQAAGEWDVRYEGRLDTLTRLLEEAPGSDERDILHWLLAPQRLDGKGSYGAALNRVLLQSAGRRAFLLDDDAHLQAFLPVDARPTALTVSTAPYQSRYFASSDAFPVGFVPQSIDPFAEHERLLGHTVGSTLSALTPEARREVARSLDRTTLDHLQATATVKLTVNGVLGDSGAPSNLRLLLAEPEALGSVLTSEGDYRALLEQHHTWRGRSGPNLSPVCVLTASTLVGLDNRSLVPPVLPLGRGEDYLFSAALEFVYPDVFIAELPWSLLHAPERQRTYDRGLFEAPVTPSKLQILAEAIRAEARRSPSRHPEERLLQLSELVCGWARLDDRAFGAMWEGLAVAARAAVLGQLEASLRLHARSPDFLRVGLQRLLELNNDFRPQTLVPGSMTAIRRDWARYGQALAIWPHLWQALRTRAPGAGQKPVVFPRSPSGRGQT